MAQCIKRRASRGPRLASNPHRSRPAQTVQPPSAVSSLEVYSTSACRRASVIHASSRGGQTSNKPKPFLPFACCPESVSNALVTCRSAKNPLEASFLCFALTLPTSNGLTPTSVSSPRGFIDYFTNCGAWRGGDPAIWQRVELRKLLGLPGQLAPAAQRVLFIRRRAEL